jgi:hypothetical protein
MGVIVAVSSMDMMCFFFGGASKLAVSHGMSGISRFVSFSAPEIRIFPQMISDIVALRFYNGHKKLESTINTWNFFE